VIQTAGAVADRATAALTDDSRAVTVFNSLSWERTALLPLPEGFDGATDEAGNPLPTQVMDGQTWVETVVPPCGWTTLRPGRSASQPAGTLKATPRLLENDVLRLTFGDQGEITTILDKESGRELTAGPCNKLGMYRDVPSSFDAWDIDSMYPLTPVELDEPASIEVVAAGPLVARLRVTRQLHDSTLIQEVSLRRGSRRVDFHTVVDWQESHKLLKVNFPVTVHANEGVHEIQFGHIRRPNHKSRPFDADRFEVCNHKWTALMEESRGCAVLNDSKYGVDVAGNSINLTLLKSALAPDMSADRGRQVFTYAFYAWNGPFAGSPLVREAYELNCAVTTAPGAAEERSLFAVDAPNVVIETVKPAEDGSPDIVVRAYEAKRTATRCTLTTSLRVVGAAQTDMLENVQRELPCEGAKIDLEFRPFEVKTVRLRMAS
jgi:alpha-mannosidase